MPAAHRDFRSIWFFSLLAGLFMVVLLGAAWLIDQQQQQVQQATQNLQQRMGPEVLRLQRLGRNLLQIHHEGDRLLLTDSKGERREALLLVTLVSQHPSLQQDPRVAQQAERATQLLGEAAADLARSTQGRAAWRARWEPLAAELMHTADDLMSQAAYLPGTDLAALTQVARQARYQLLATMVLAGLFSLVFLWLLHRRVLQPLLGVHQALLKLQAGQALPMLPRSAVREVVVLGEALNTLAATMTENELVRHQLEFQAHHDSLTGLPNRRHFMAQAYELLHRLRREHRPALVGMADLDFFKRVNDEHSHAAGDEVLRQCGRLLREALRTQDLICRFGGEEFAFVLVGCDVRAGLALAERLRHTLERHQFILPDGKVLPGMTVSIGLAPMGVDGLEKALGEADKALYRAKGEGRNRVVLEERTVAA
ncbi:MAG: diguanylate cyclase [Curvibacter lanceolatus]|jgi:diguanylate cyclase (GGDEF)-like protein|uniref:GGDEF domain-containing protein n=1 Tax=Curvibacter lanceolatus TaxID=86182 RepID=UPI002352995F|nr:GGDEF domain-containing protein [Curvibacter lanceolatus]MBV5291072.1 diguanylate cyclase [Curvibacter lanceolatus]